MTRTIITKSTFSAGELDPRLLGRIDLRALEEGARRLLNVVVHPTGGVSRRAGTRFLHGVAGAARLIDFEGPDGPAMAVLGDRTLDILEDGILVRVDDEAPWTAGEAQVLSCARYGRKLILCHPDYRPRILAKSGSGDARGWALSDLVFEAFEPGNLYSPRAIPFSRFADGDVSMEAAKLSDGVDGEPAAYRLLTSQPFFQAGHRFTYVRFRGGQFFIQQVMSDHEAVASALGPVLEETASYDWQEEAFSAVRGFPAAVTFHQDRLVLAGGREEADRLWFSKTGRPFYFSLGEGLDDEPVSFRLRSERLHRVVGLVAGRHLQVFTTAGEWIVRGWPLTPSDVRADLQTRIGSRAPSTADPVSVDGATLFVGAGGRELREFIFTDSEQAYQAADLALLSRHLIHDPVDMAFDGASRLLWIVERDGRLLSVTIDRNSNIVAWASHAVADRVRAVSMYRGQLHLLVELGGQVLLERLDPALGLDHAITVAGDSIAVSDAAHLGSRAATVVDQRSVLLEGPLTDEPAAIAGEHAPVQCGLRFTHVIEAMPLNANGRFGAGLDTLFRLVRAAFRVLESRQVRADLGGGYRMLLDRRGEHEPLTGDVTGRAIGWRRGVDVAPWRISHDGFQPFTLLGVTTELKVND